MAVEKLPGVTGANVSLEEGLVTVLVRPDTRLTIAGLRKAIRDQGFSPRAADVWVSGRISSKDDGFTLSVPGSGITYATLANEVVLGQLRDAAGRDVLLEGRIAEDEDGTTPTVLMVTSVVGS